MWNRSLPTILFTHYGDNWIRGSERCLLDLMNNINRKKYNIVLWCNSEILSEAATKLKIDVILTNFSVLFSSECSMPLPDYTRIIQIGNHLVEKYKVNIIHSNSGAPNIWLNPISRYQRLPLIVHLHAHYSLRDRVTLGLHHVPMTVGVSPAVLAEFHQDGSSPQQLRIIPNGLDVQELNKQPTCDLRNTLGLNDQTILISTTGSLIHRKGIDIAISSVVNLHKQGLPVHLVIFGEGPQRITLQRQIHAACAQKYIHLYGESEEIVGLLKSGVDIFISTARKEAFGLAIAEASLSGIPVIAPRSGEFPNIIIEGKTGLLFDPKDPSTLETEIRKIISDKKIAMLMGENGKKHVEQNYGLSNYIAQFEELYDSMLKDKNMRMNWLSHWKIVAIIKLSIRRIFKLRKAIDVNGLTQ